MKASRIIPQPEDQLLLARIEDTLQNADQRSRMSFVGFLDRRQALLARAAAERSGSRWMIWGGYPEAERVLFGAFPFYAEPSAEDFPLAAVTVRYRSGAVLSHRDLLGSLMALGVERDVLGDLLLENGRAVFFTKAELLPYFLQQLTQVGGEGVRVESGFTDPLPAGSGFAPLSDTVASPRLDAVVAALCHCGRSTASELISRGAVNLNYTECLSSSHDVEEEDILTVRGKGKFIIDQIGPLTKKGRLALRARKYI